jgi:NADH:ubiquinone oxidoreductase subunit F (NADH-binding)
MEITCSSCGGGIKPKWTKIAVVAGGAAVMAPLAAMFGLKAGLFALGAAALSGRPHAAQLLQMKIRLMKASHDMGSFFQCGSCGRDAPVAEVFSQLGV